MQNNRSTGMNLVLIQIFLFFCLHTHSLSLCFFLSFTVSLSASCAPLRSLKATVLTCPALNWRQPKQCNKRHCGSKHIWHRHSGREEERNTKTEKKRNRAAGDQWTGRKLGIFQQKRMQSVDLPGFVLADARKSCCQIVTNSSFMVTLPYSYISRKIWGCLLWVCGWCWCGR